MPELPEVQTVVDTLRPKIVAQAIRQVHLHRSDILRPAGFDLHAHLFGRVVTDVSRRGKRVIITLDNGHRFYIHLGMTGRLTIETDPGAIAKHTHLILAFQGFAVHFRDPRRFGGVWWLGDAPDPDGMGPEPLSLRWQELAARLGRTHRAIKNALLDQHLIAGLGNIYVDEALFVARIHPLKLAHTLSCEQIRRLNPSIKRILRKAIRHRGSTLRDYVDAEGGRGAFQKLHNVYGREDLPCRKCRTPIQRIVLGGRSTCFCPKCQSRGAS